MANNDILLETGTGELEVLRFSVGKGEYAINVIKIREILDVDKFSIIPKSNPAIIGMTLVRGEVIPLIDMKFVLEGIHSDTTNIKTLLCEFNSIKVAFVVAQVKSINRIPWKDIKKPEGVVENMDTLVIGNITFGNEIVMLLDFEKVVTDIEPSTGITKESVQSVEKKDRSNIKVVLSDDSALIRKLLKDSLINAGFDKLTFFNDGQEAWNYLQDIAKKDGEDFTQDVDILITDVEMPQMDGHTLTRLIKQDNILKNLPVIIFSSLITDTLRHKGESVHADAQMSKPEIVNLINVVDELIAKRDKSLEK